MQQLETWLEATWPTWETTALDRDHDEDFDGFFDISSPVIIYQMVSPGDSLSITEGILMIKIRYYNY